MHTQEDRERAAEIVHETLKLYPRSPISAERRAALVTNIAIALSEERRRAADKVLTELAASKITFAFIPVLAAENDAPATPDDLMTLDEALRNPQGFVDGMTETKSTSLIVYCPSCYAVYRVDAERVLNVTCTNCDRQFAVASAPRSLPRLDIR